MRIIKVALELNSNFASNVVKGNSQHIGSFKKKMEGKKEQMKIVRPENIRNKKFSHPPPLLSYAIFTTFINNNGCSKTGSLFYIDSSWGGGCNKRLLQL